jgi:hypothetical protein
MTFNAETYLPKPKNWFTTDIKYEGYGRAEFADPQGWVEGNVFIEFNTLGHAAIEMEISKHYNSHNPNAKYSLERLLSGQKPDEDLHWWTSGLSGPKNQCTSFVVQSDDFIFTAKGQIDFEHFFTGASNKLPFYCSQSFVDFRTDKRTKFWVMPLLNFVSDFGLYYRGLNNHPLRLYDFPEIQDNLSDMERHVAHSNQEWLNALILFESEGNRGFIERLPDFPQRKEALKNSPYAITALMNCEIGESQSTDLEELWKWFPIQFLDLLSLATGTRVSCPWIEFRDEHGDIVSRLHIPQWSRQYVDGHHIIYELVHQGIGLTRMLSLKSLLFIPTSKPVVKIMRRSCSTL